MNSEVAADLLGSTGTALNLEVRMRPRTRRTREGVMVPDRKMDSLGIRRVP